MRKLVEQRIFKIAGIYLIIMLALVRFMVYPLHASIAKKKIIFNDLRETYQIKLKHFERRELERNEPVKTRMDKEVVAPCLYEKGMPLSTIQADALGIIIKIAETKGLTVQSFEMPEPSPGKITSDVPILIRLSGKPVDLLDSLRTIMSDRKVMLVRNLEMSKSGQESFLILNITAFRMEK